MEVNDPDDPFKQGNDFDYYDEEDEDDNDPYGRA